MRYDAEHKQKTRDRVLREAAKAIRREGAAGIGVAGVMKSAGLTHGGFYAHFRSREELVAAGVGQMFDEGRARLAAADSEDPKAALLAYLDFYLSPAHRRTRTAGCPLPFLSAEAPRLPQAARERFAAGAAALRNALAARLVAIGEPDADAQASSMLAEMVGAVSLARAEPDDEVGDLILSRSRASICRRVGLEPRA